MPRLIRPPIPVETKCRVALLQLGEMFPDAVVGEHARKFGKLLKALLARLADLLKCEVTDLRLDHDPALGARQKVFDAAGRHVEYIPSANSVEHLRYRPHGPQFERSHLIKTNVRGDHGQFPDRVLIKRQRRMEKAEAEQRGEKPRYHRPKTKWAARPMQSANRWPPKGSQKIRSRPRKTR